MKHKLEHVEIMIINACQLACKSCATFSDIKHSGYVTWEQGKKQLLPWLERLDLECIGIMGGEPFMNPDLKNWLHGLRELLPDTQIRLPTNGLLLHKHMDVVNFMNDIGNCILKISYHVDNTTLRRTIKQIINAYNFRPVTEYGINRWSTANNFKFQINNPIKFLQSYKGDYSTMSPHDSDPKEAFDACVCQRCAFLHDNKLFKCSIAGLTPELHKRFNRPNNQQWQPYLNTGADINCSDTVLDQFVKNFGKPHAMCRQCPTMKDSKSIIDHKTTVAFK